MAGMVQKYPLEEYSRRGQEIFERKVAAGMTNLPDESYVAIDINSEDVEIDPNWNAAVDRLKSRNPEAQIWVRQAGSRRFCRIFGGPAPSLPPVPPRRAMVPKYSPETYSQRGDEIFHRVIADQVCHLPPETFVLIDIDSEDFEVGLDSQAANGRLLGRRPAAQVWGRRVGSSATYHLGGRLNLSGRPRVEKGTSTCMAE